MSNTWFTADLHLGHNNIRKYCNRPFESVGHMNKKLISNWNEVVGVDDTIYHLGDFCFGDTYQYKNSLNGKIIFIRGSHDIIADPYMMIIEPAGLLDEYGNKRTIVLCHYAMRSWPLSHYASWHLFGHCFDLETEVLTMGGWKKRNDIKQDDQIMTLNTSNNLLEYNFIKEIIDYSHTGEIIEVKSKGLDLNITSNHVLIEQEGWKTGISYRKFLATDIDKLSKRNFIKSGYLKQKGLNLSDNLLRLMIWVVADGSLCNSSLIRIQLYKERKIQRLEKLLSQLKISYRKLPTKNGGWYINFTRPKELDEFSLKPLDSKVCCCNENQAEIILREYSETDGHTYGKEKNIVMIWTSKENEANLLQIMCIINGYQCNITTRNNRGFSNKPNYQLTVTKRITRTASNIASRTTRNFVYDQPYWCLSVENETLFIRRNGKPIIVGNSHGKLEPYGLSFDVGTDTNNFYPYSLKEVEKRMSTLKPIVDFRKEKK